MASSNDPESYSGPAGSTVWFARDSKTGKAVEMGAGSKPSVPAQPTPGKVRRPGRFKGIIKVGPEFFEPLSDEELAGL